MNTGAVTEVTEVITEMKEEAVKEEVKTKPKMRLPIIVPRKPSKVVSLKHEAPKEKLPKELSEDMETKNLKKAKVVCVKVDSIRPKYDNLKEWMEDSQNVYVARKGVVLLDNPATGKKARFPPADSKFANPYTVKEYGLEKAIELYREYLKKQIAEGKITREDLAALKGKNLGCWCDPGGPCHGYVILEFI